MHADPKPLALAILDYETVIGEGFLLARAGQGIRTACSFGDSRCTRIVKIVLRKIAEGRNQVS